MPIYEFVCEACQHEFDELVRGEKPARDLHCPTCGSPEVNRKLSLFAAHQPGPQSRSPAQGGGCGRCGDPNGPCSL